MIEAVTCGEPLVLLQPTERGPLDQVRDLVVRVAGAELNVAVGLSRLGIGAAFLGAVGDDPFGRRIAKTLGGENVDSSGLRRLPAPTGVFFKEWYGLGVDPNIYYYRRDSAGSLWAYDPAAWPLPETVRWLHTSGITLMVGRAPHDSSLFLARTLAARAGTTSLDLNLRLKLADAAAWRDIIEPTLGQWAVIFATRDELSLLWGADDPRALFDTGRLQSGQTLVVKTGTDGASAHWTGGRVDVPRVPVQGVVDSVGAGDGFAAGVIAGRLKGLAWREALAVGSVVGAFAVAHPGDYEGYPTWAMVQSTLRNDSVTR